MRPPFLHLSAQGLYTVSCTGLVIFKQSAHPNPVGYSTQEIAGGKLTCAAFQFSDVSAEAATLGSISTTGLNPGVYETMEEQAPCIMIFDGNAGYDYYYFISDAYDADGKEVTAWANFSGDVADSEITVGTGFWMRIPEDLCSTGSMTEAGQVLSSATATIEIAAGLTLGGNPYPTALDLGKAVTSGIVAGVYETMEENAPCIMIYDGNAGYDYYYYISDAYDADGKEVTAWANFSGDAVTEAIAPAGTGFWARSATAGMITFSL